MSLNIKKIRFSSPITEELYKTKSIVLENLGIVVLSEFGTKFVETYAAVNELKISSHPTRPKGEERIQQEQFVFSQMHLQMKGELQNTLFHFYFNERNVGHVIGIVSARYFGKNNKLVLTTSTNGKYVEELIETMSKII